MRAILSALLILSGCAGWNSLSNDNKPVPVASATPLTTGPQPSISASASSTLETPTPSETVLTSSPEPFIPIETTAPLSFDVFLTAEPKELCFGEIVTVKGKYDSDNVFSIYLEKKVMRDGKIPPLYNEHILLGKVTIKKGVEFLYPFTVQKQMRDAGDQHVLNVSPAEYFVRVVTSSETLGAGVITIKDCQK